MSVKRRELVKYLAEHGYELLQEGGNHSINSDGTRTVPIKRHRKIGRITANEICKQAGLEPKF